MKLAKVIKSNQLKVIKSLLIFAPFLFLIGCSASFGEKYTLGNLEIYYTSENVSDRLVIATGAYFKENDLILDHPHSIQLTSDETSYLVRIVLEDPTEELTEIARINFQLLEDDLREKVFSGMNVKIELCNANFSVVQTL